MSGAKRAKRLIPQPSAAAPAEDPRVVKLRIAQLTDRLRSLILEKPEIAKKAASILKQWLEK